VLGEKHKSYSPQIICHDDRFSYPGFAGDSSIIKQETSRRVVHRGRGTLQLSGWLHLLARLVNVNVYTRDDVTTETVFGYHSGMYSVHVTRLAIK